MRIGILTHHYVSNFGAYLQAYCLTRAISKLRPSDTVEIIDFAPLKHRLINTAGMLRFDPKRETFASWLEKIKLVGTFNEARKELPLTKSVKSAQDIKALGLDVIVVGSDEVWNYLDVRSFQPMKFGVGLEGCRLAAYSPSVGIVNDFSNMPTALAEGLKSFKALSARDDATARMLDEKVKKSYTRTLDPVFIGEMPDGRTERVKKLTKKPYALMYHFGLPYEKQREALFPALKKRGLTILGAGEYNKGYDEISVNLTPFEMAELFRGAERVFTGTFHGVVLSVIKKTPFVVCPNNPTRARKLESLLRQLGLGDRMTDPDKFDFDACWNEGIDYGEVYKNLDAERGISLGYLSREALKEE